MNTPTVDEVLKNVEALMYDDSIDSLVMTHPSKVTRQTWAAIRMQVKSLCAVTRPASPEQTERALLAFDGLLQFIDDIRKSGECPHFDGIYHTEPGDALYENAVKALEALRAAGGERKL